MSDNHFVYRHECEIWLQDIMDKHYEEALSRVDSLLSQTLADENECWVAARFVYCVVNRAVLDCGTVVRHRCHNCRRFLKLFQGGPAFNYFPAM